MFPAADIIRPYYDGGCQMSSTFKRYTLFQLTFARLYLGSWPANIHKYICSTSCYYFCKIKYTFSYSCNNEKVRITFKCNCSRVTYCFSFSNRFFCVVIIVLSFGIFSLYPAAGPVHKVLVATFIIHRVTAEYPQCPTVWPPLPHRPLSPGPFFPEGSNCCSIDV